MFTIEILNSDKDTHFTGAITQNNKEDESIDFPTNWGLINIHKVKIHQVKVQSDENLDWDILLWSNNGFDNTDLDTDALVIGTESPMFPGSDAQQINGTGQYYYPVVQPSIPLLYVDTDNTGKLHCSLINRSVAAKTAGSDGEVKITFTLEPVM